MHASAEHTLPDRSDAVSAQYMGLHARRLALLDLD